MQQHPALSKGAILLVLEQLAISSAKAPPLQPAAAAPMPGSQAFTAGAPRQGSQAPGAAAPPPASVPTHASVGGCGPAHTVPAVRAFYAAIVDRNLDALLALLAKDVEWDCFGLPTSAQKARHARAPPAPAMCRVTAVV